MTAKFSKFDIGSMHRRQKEKPVKRVIKREVMDHSFILRSQKPVVKPRTTLIAPTTPTPFTTPAKPWSFSSLIPHSQFAGAAIALVLVFGAITYLSSARHASKEILGSATSAYSQIQSAGANLSSQNFTSARGLFVSAQNNIRLAQEKLNNFKALKIFTPQAKSADHMLSGASYLAEAGGKLSQAMSLFEELKVTSNGIETENFNGKVKQNRDLLKESKALIDLADKEFSEVVSVPADYAGTLEAGKTQVSQLSSILGQLIDLEDLYIGFFTEQPKTYLLLFQNYDEARATGGFIGTYGVLKTAAGKIDKLKIESIYNIDGQIFEQIAAPGPFQPDIKRWGMRDANWFADFPTSAEKLLYFFEKGGETADGAVMITPQLFSQLLALTGSIQMSQYGVTLTSENFQDVVQFETSVNYDKELNQPKKFLSDFAPILLNRLTNLGSEQWLNLFQILQNNLDQKQVLLYSKDPVMEQRIKEIGVSGAISDTPYDYLNIVNSNLGGTKTDLDVAQSAFLESKLLSDGSVLNTITIKRDNSSSEKNKSFMRVMVPQGSSLVSASGFDAYDFRKSESEGLRADPDLAAWDQGEMVSDVFVRTETGKTEFSGWLNTPGLEERTVTLTYLLPFKVSNNQGYSLLLQKQSGSKPYEFSGLWNLGSKDSEWASNGVVVKGNVLTFKSNSAADDFWGIVIAK